MKSLLKIILPVELRYRLRQAQKAVVYFSRRQRIRIPIACNAPLKIIVGAAMTREPGWYSTNEQWLDITQSSDWKRVFGGKALLSHVIAEHVFEHLTPSQTRQALDLIAKHMLPGGRIRIAVPDGYHPDTTYLKHVGIAGIGADAADHKQLLNSDSLKSFLQDAGFDAELMEGYLKNGTLVQKPLDSAGGMISRHGWEFVDANTSLVIDGCKIE